MSECVNGCRLQEEGICTMYVGSYYEGQQLAATLDRNHPELIQLLPKAKCSPVNTEEIIRQLKEEQ